jgi:L-lactate dehydrogenase complex protein LldE
MPDAMRVALFVTCLVDQFFPAVGLSMVKVLRRLDVEVHFNPAQTCCGQPLFNTGYRREARALAARFLDLFEASDYVVAPSGSCTAMTRIFYPELFADAPRLLDRAGALAPRLYEFSEFLVKVVGRENVGARFPARVTYHDACHLLRELRVRDEPRRLLRSVRELDFVELEASDTCCGFGGTFAVKFPDISTAMLQDKVNRIAASGATVVVANDSSCLMQIAGALRRQGLPVRPMHLAEVLAQE